MVSLLHLFSCKQADEVFGVDFSPKGDTIVTGGYDSTFDCGGSTELYSNFFYWHQGRVFDFHPDGAVTRLGGWKTVKVWRIDGINHKLKDIPLLTKVALKFWWKAHCLCGVDVPSNFIVGWRDRPGKPVHKFTHAVKKSSPSGGWSGICMTPGHSRW